jgi:hypothetical protein
MKAKKAMVETTVYTTFVVPLAEVLAAYVPEAERNKPLCTWWVTSGAGEGNVELVRMEKAAIAYDAEGRELLEAEAPRADSGDTDEFTPGFAP